MQAKVRHHSPFLTRSQSQLKMSQHSAIDAAYLAGCPSTHVAFLRALLSSAVHAALSGKENSDHVDSESMMKWLVVQPYADVSKTEARLSRLKGWSPKTFEVMRLGAPWVDAIKCAARSNAGQAYLKSIFVRFHSARSHS